jgi:hypothetical protein
VQRRLKTETNAFAWISGGSGSGIYTRKKGSLRAGGFPETVLPREILEPLFSITPTFTKQESGFYRFTGYELGGLLCKK